MLLRGPCLALTLFVAACDSPLMDLGQEVTLAAAVDEQRRPVEPRERFTLEDERIHIQVAIPPDFAGPEQRDFHLELFDGDGKMIAASGRLMTRTRPDWRVTFPYRINREIDAPGLWSADLYVDGRHLERVRFPVTETPDAPRPEPDRPLLTGGCCRAPGTRSFQVFFADGVNEDTFRLEGRRESFRTSDSQMYVYVRLLNVAPSAHELRFVFLDGAGKQVWTYKNAFSPTSRSWMAWVHRGFIRSTDTPGIWTVHIYLDGALLGSVTVPVEA